MVLSLNFFLTIYYVVEIFPMCWMNLQIFVIDLIGLTLFFVFNFNRQVGIFCFRQQLTKSVAIFKILIFIYFFKQWVSDIFTLYKGVYIGTLGYFISVKTIEFETGTRGITQNKIWDYNI